MRSDSVKYLRDSTFDWCFISIGDIETNQNWKYKDIQFIDTYQQNKLKDKFKIINKIPFNSYFRKIIGYLITIEQKANFIYEINDFNSAQDGLLGFKYETFNGIKSSCNDYEPLIIESPFKKCKIYSLTNIYPIIQYSLNETLFKSKPNLILANSYSNLGQLNIKKYFCKTFKNKMDYEELKNNSLEIDQISILNRNHLLNMNFAKPSLIEELEKFLKVLDYKYIELLKRNNNF